MERLDLTKLQIGAIAAHLHDELADDERAWLDLLEGETDLYEWVRRLLGKIEDDEGVEASLATQISDRSLRKSRAGERIKAARQAISALLETAKLSKLELPEATVSVRDVPPKPIVVDEAAIPDEFCRTVRKPDMALIKAGMESGEVPGVSRDNGGVTLTIRRK